MVKKLSKKAKSIYEGWHNFIKQDNPEIEKLAKERAEICGKCDKPEESKILYAIQGSKEGIQEAKGLVCGACNCPLSTKIRVSNENCPLMKW